MSTNRGQIIDMTPDHLKSTLPDITSVLNGFLAVCSPLEREAITLLVDARTGARYCECHVKASTIVALATVDVPLDPEEQPDYRANREIVEDAVAYQAMKEDAKLRRSFSNIVVEFTRDFQKDYPIKIIGGQHRFNAIREALEQGVDEYHGLKVYFGLDPEQRLDVQLISNTNIAVSSDLFDRMQETLAGPQLRTWCQAVGLLEPGSDFADRRQRGRQITVREVRSFIINFYRGQSVKAFDFDKTDTTPILCKSGVPDPDWERLRVDDLSWPSDQSLKRAGQEYARLRAAQREAFSSSSGKKGYSVDVAEKASSFAVLSAWAYVAGLLTFNSKRMNRHFALSDHGKPDPLNASALAKGRHKTDAENYRGLGYRTDAKERGRFVELFYLQAEKGSGIDKSMIDVAIKKYHAKRALLEVLEAQRKSEE
jgi:hypothetical protein